MKTRKLAVLSIFAALIVILQLIATYINFGGFPITLTLIPIIIAGAVYGPFVGLCMGLIFGIVVTAMVFLGLDPGGTIMITSHPVITALLCLSKGALAGLTGAFAYKTINNKKIAIVVDALITPIINTSILYIGLLLFFDRSFAILVISTSIINFIIEVLTNVLLSSGLIDLIKRSKYIH